MLFFTDLRWAVALLIGFPLVYVSWEYTDLKTV